jgi:hypothetical protein
MRLHQRPSLRLGGQLDLKLRRRHDPTRRHLNQLATGVVEQGEQHQHRLHRRPVALEIRADVHPPRQSRLAVAVRFAGQVQTTGRCRHLPGLRHRAHLDDHAAAPGSRLVAVIARIARFRAPRRPYSPAHIDVSTSIMSRTRSSVVSPGSVTTIRRPCAASAASRCSTPKRANQSRCSTTMTFASGSDKMRRSLGRFALSPEPTSHTTWPTFRSCSVAHPVRRATCRSKSER